MHELYIRNYFTFIRLETIEGVLWMGEINGGNGRLRAEAKVSKGWIARSLVTGHRNSSKSPRDSGDDSRGVDRRFVKVVPRRDVGRRRQCRPIFNVSASKKMYAAHFASQQKSPILPSNELSLSLSSLYLQIQITYRQRSLLHPDI